MLEKSIWCFKISISSSGTTATGKTGAYDEIKNKSMFI